MRYEVDWTVSGTSTVEVSDQEWAQAGIDPDSMTLIEALTLLDERTGYDIGSEVVSDFDQRERPVFESVLEEWI